LVPKADVVGLDGDPKVLEIARSKAAKAGVILRLDYGMAYQLPYPDGSFDRVLSSLVFHHLVRDDKRRTMGEVYRVLQPGGEFHLVDFGKPRSLYGYLLSPFMKRLEQASDNISGLLPVMMREAGFSQVEEVAHFTTVFGTLTSVRAGKPR
jgi:ubiquinone/menaquinone biosynthesis C-methylase UbiE